MSVHSSTEGVRRVAQETSPTGKKKKINLVAISKQVSKLLKRLQLL
jgi:hypothetical protein